MFRSTATPCTARDSYSPVWFMTFCAFLRILGACSYLRSAGSWWERSWSTFVAVGLEQRQPPLKSCADPHTFEAHTFIASTDGRPSNNPLVCTLLNPGSCTHLRPTCLVRNSTSACRRRGQCRCSGCSETPSIAAQHY